MMVWTDERLTTKDPNHPVFIKKRHIDELRHSDGGAVEEDEKEKVQSKNLKEIDFSENSVVHKAIEYNPTKENRIGYTHKFTDSHFLKDGIIKDTLFSSDWEEAADMRMVSDIFAPTGQVQSITTALSTFIKAGHLKKARDLIAKYSQYPPLSLRQRTRQTLNELLGIARTEINCPFAGCDFTILPTEFYCSRTSREEPRVEWYQREDDEWDIRTWTDPFLHMPLQAKLTNAYSKGTTQITVPSALGYIPIIPDSETREQALYGDLTFSLPDNSYLFFNNHHRRYRITSIEGNDIIFTPELEFDVKKDSYLVISNHKVYQAEQDTATVIIDASNSLLIELDEFKGKYGFGHLYKAWESKYKINKYFFVGTWIRFQGHETVYAIKSAKSNLVDGNYQIELTENLKRPIEKDEAIFLYTPRKAKHWEEIRTALDNLDPLPKENDWGYYERFHERKWERGNRVSPPEKNWVTGGSSTIEETKWGVLGEEDWDWSDDIVTVCPYCGGTDSIYLYTYWAGEVMIKVSYGLDILKGISQYVYEGSQWRQQIISGQVIKYYKASVQVRKFDEEGGHECSECYEYFTSPTTYPLGILFEFEEFEHQSAIANGVSTVEELLGFEHSSYMWLNDIRRSFSDILISFKNSKLYATKRAEEYVVNDISFNAGEYVTLLGNMITSTKQEYDDFVEG